MNKFDEYEPPVRYTGQKTADIRLHDGGLRPVVGAKNYQVLRANRSEPEPDGTPGWTYNHAPMLARWQGRFYLEYLSNPVGEHIPPGRTLLMHSKNGRDWSKPVAVFPPYRLPDGIYSIDGRDMELRDTDAVMHQRMGFYVSSANRLLVSGFYGISAKNGDGMPNNGRGVGRVVREVLAGGGFGPIHFLRYNRHAGWNENNTDYPFYKESEDSGFTAACEELLEDRLATLQWWEEDRSPDGFYAVAGERAFCHYRAGEEIIGVWKSGHCAISSDEGKSWSPVVKAKGIITSGGKTWAQQTADGRYAMVYNPVPDSPHRWPLAVTLSDDGRSFSGLLCVHGEVPPKRYAGKWKDDGPCYVRGIEAGEGCPDKLWLTYSVNKEDIWVTSLPVPVLERAGGPVHDTFEGLAEGECPELWNIYSPLWSAVGAAALPGEEGLSLLLQHSDPCDYAKAVRIFPEDGRVNIRTGIAAGQNGFGRLEIEVLGSRGELAFRLELAGDGQIYLHGGAGRNAVGRYSPLEWIGLDMRVDAQNQKMTLTLNGNALPAIAFMGAMYTVERIAFRTGTTRRGPWADMPGQEADLTNCGEPERECRFYIKELHTESYDH
ncbi:glycoside hydrolase [Paenibacillus sp. S150]|uniref:glycoside hydrolase n=1 Tax=Paenibacillus sp. S150 TaxID=2749826 RepID=UPI001C562EAE|nr:glycoside hydrolase [Paenibacillus sp. S150]MBW4083386.1 exo-alpha-sialidase [Paenibacillus sp. S150]